MFFHRHLSVFKRLLEWFSNLQQLSFEEQDFINISTFLVYELFSPVLKDKNEQTAR